MFKFISILVTGAIIRLASLKFAKLMLKHLSFGNEGYIGTIIN